MYQENTSTKLSWAFLRKIDWKRKKMGNPGPRIFYKLLSTLLNQSLLHIRPIIQVRAKPRVVGAERDLFLRVRFISRDVRRGNPSSGLSCPVVVLVSNGYNQDRHGGPSLRHKGYASSYIVTPPLRVGLPEGKAFDEEAEPPAKADLPTGVRYVFYCHSEYIPPHPIPLSGLALPHASRNQIGLPEEERP